MKRRWCALAWALAWTAAGATPASEAPAPLTVVTEQYWPLSYSQDGKLRGYAVEIAEQLLARAQLSYRMQAYPWARAYAMARARPNVLIFSLVRTPEREPLFHWIGAIGQRNVYLYKLARRTEVRLGALDELQHYTTAVNRGDTVQAQLERRGLQAGRQIDLSNNSVSSLDKLIAGRVDFIASTEMALPALCARAGIATSELERTLPLPGASAYYIAASHGTAEATVLQLRLELAAMQQSGWLRRVAEKYAVDALLK